MAGIEEAFNNFVKRISQKENQEDKIVERGYQYGGGTIGYSGGGLAPITFATPIAPGYAYGGYISQGSPVNTNLTTTVPPVRGPMPQGVETLFKRRYS